MRRLALVLLVLYAYVVATLTLRSTTRVTWAYGVTDRVYAMSEPQANVVLFVPAGFLLAIVLLSPVFAVSVGVLASMAIEWTQRELLPSRVADLHDVVNNGLGTVVGALLAVPFVFLLARHAPVAAAPRSHVS